VQLNRLEAKDVDFKYGQRIVLESFTTTVIAGQSVALVGPSGSGKSTALALLGGLLKPNKGTVRMTGGGVLSSGISWVPQGVNLLPFRSATDNVAIGSYAAGRSGRIARQKACSLLEAMGLGHRKTALARQLSGGEAQRVAIARALAFEPSFVLADEPTGQLDQKTTDIVVRHLFDVCDEHSVGLILATHDDSVAARCDRICQISGEGPS